MTADRAECLSLGEDGAEHHPGAAAGALAAMLAAFEQLPADRPGIRLHDVDPLPAMLAPGGALGAIATRHLGPRSRAVRAILFDKNERTNWALGWHQDRTICVAERRDMTDFGPWSRKQGIQHVEPPFALLQRMLTMRVHLDDVPQSNGPLLVALGSHRYGKIREGDIAGAVAQCRTLTCLARAGDIWLYSTPILHASHAATLPSRRRVLQVDFSADDLPADLQWLGV